MENGEWEFVLMFHAIRSSANTAKATRKARARRSRPMVCLLRRLSRLVLYVFENSCVLNTSHTGLRRRGEERADCESGEGRERREAGLIAQKCANCRKELVNTNLKQLETHAETHDQKVWTK